MSRPPREYHPQYLSDRPIDFIGQHYEPTECHNSYVYTQAGFPGKTIWIFAEMPST